MTRKKPQFVPVGGEVIRCLPGTGAILADHSGYAVVCTFGKDRVIKYARLYSKDADCLFKKLWQLKTRKRKHVARIYEFGKLHQNTLYTWYYYVSERLHPLGQEDARHLDRYCESSLVYTPKKIQHIADLASRMGYQDNHAGNFMKAKDGTLKIVDIEGFYGY